jgi:hypothetical protein
MKRLVLFLFALMISPAYAGGQGGLTCTLNINGQQQEWRISGDSDRGLFTVRAGNQIVMRQKTMSLNYGVGANVQPYVDAFKFFVELNAMQAFLVVKADGGTAFTTPLSGDNARNVGRCTDSPFEGL